VVVTVTEHSVFDMIKRKFIGGVIVSVVSSRLVDHGFEPRSSQPKTIKFAFVAFHLSMQH
jgi:hypothetical protein